MLPWNTSASSFVFVFIFSFFFSNFFLFFLFICSLEQSHNLYYLHRRLCIGFGYGNGFSYGFSSASSASTSSSSSSASSYARCAFYQLSCTFVSSCHTHVHTESKNYATFTFHHLPVNS